MGPSHHLVYMIVPASATNSMFEQAYVLVFFTKTELNYQKLRQAFWAHFGLKTLILMANLYKF